jgi:hypothetical protein
MSEPLSNLAIDNDPQEKQWAVAYAGSPSSARAKGLSSRTQTSS